MDKKNNKENNIDNREQEMHNDAETDDVVIDDLEDVDAVSGKIKKIRAKLSKCEDEKKEYLDGWQRCKADFINTRKRDEEVRVSGVASAKESVIASILPVLDSFDMAFSNKESLKDFDQNWLTGVLNIQTQLQNILKEYNVSEIDPIDEKFDPTRHDSVESRDVEGKDGVVVEVLQKGFEMNGKIIRAAKVVVGQHAK